MSAIYNEPGLGTQFNISPFSLGTTYCAECFVGDGSTLTSVTVWLRFGSGIEQGPITCTIDSVVGTPGSGATSALNNLQTSPTVLDASSLSGSFQPYTFTFPGVALSVGVGYAFTLSWSDPSITGGEVDVQQFNGTHASANADENGVANNSTNFRGSANNTVAALVPYAPQFGLFLYAGDASPSNVRLLDPTTADTGGAPALSGFSVGAAGLAGSAVGKKSTAGAVLGAAGLSDLESAKKNAVGTTVGNVGAKSTTAGAQGAILFSTGRVGAAASEVGIHNATGATVGRVGLSSTEAGRHEALSSTVGRVGVSASAVGSQLTAASGFSTGRVGLASTLVGKRNALSTTAAAVGLAASEAGSRSSTSTTAGRIGVAASAFGSSVPPVYGSAIGAVGLTGASTSIAGFEAATSSGGGGGFMRAVKRTLRKLLPERHQGGARGALGLSARAHGVAFIPPEIEPQQPEKVPPLSLDAIRRLLERIRDEAPAPELEPEIEPAPVVATGFASIRLRTHGAASGRAQLSLVEPIAPLAPVAEPALQPPPLPVLQPEPVRAVGFARGVLRLVGGAQGIPAVPDEAIDPADEIALIAMLDELADIDMVA